MPSCFKVGMDQSTGAPCWSGALAGQADCDIGVARNGPERRRELCTIPSRSQPSSVVASPIRPGVAVAFDPPPGSRRWPSGVWDRRNPGAGRGTQIKAKGIYRDAVRSSGSHFVKASGLRWISLMWLTHIPWACRTWALPVLTALAPSERYYRKMGRAPKKLTDRARQIILQLRRWLPTRPLVLVADSSYAALDLLHFCQSLTQPVTLITRLRLDAALYEPAPSRQPGQNGRPRVKGERLPTVKEHLVRPDEDWTRSTVAWYDGTTRTVRAFISQTAVWYHSGKPPVPIRWVLIRDPLEQFDPQALLCTDLAVAPVKIMEWFVLRWQLEVTFQEVRSHLGVETQRQWSDRAIARTTPVLFGLFSWISLAAHMLQKERPDASFSSLVRQAPTDFCRHNRAGVETCGTLLTLFPCPKREITKYRRHCSIAL